MQKIIFIYPLDECLQERFVYAQTARRLFNEGVAVEVITIGQRGKLPPLLDGLPHHHLDSPPDAQGTGIQMAYLSTQFRLYKYLLQYDKEEVIFFANSLRSTGAGLAIKRLNKTLILQYDERKYQSKLLEQFSRWVAGKTASKVIYRTHRVQQEKGIHNTSASIIYTPLPNSFTKEAQGFCLVQENTKPLPFQLLVTCQTWSPTIKEKLLKIVKACPNFQVLAWYFSPPATHAVVKGDCSSHPNLKIEAAPSHRAPVYQQTHLYVELDEPQIDELSQPYVHSVREAMEYGIPILTYSHSLGQEWIKSGINGYVIASEQIEELISKIKLLAHSELLYNRLSANSLATANGWRGQVACRELAHIFFEGKMKCTFRTGINV